MAANTIQQTRSGSGVNTTNLTVTFLSACVSGSRIVASLGTERPSVGIWCHDDLNNSLTLDKQDLNTVSGSIGEGRGQVYSQANTRTDAVAISASPDSGVSMRMEIYEITNPAGTPVVDVTAGQNANSNTALSLSLTTTAANCTIILAFGGYGGPSADSGYTFGSLGLFWSYGANEYKEDVGAAGTKTLTLGSYSGIFGVAAVAYAPPSGGGGGGTTYFKTVGGTITMSGAVEQSIRIHKVLAGSITSTGTLRKMTRKSFAGSVTAAGTITKRTKKSLSGSLTATGALVKKTMRKLAGSITASGNLVEAFTFKKSLAGSILMSGALSTFKYLATVATALGRVVHLRRFIGRR